MKLWSSSNGRGAALQRLFPAILVCTVAFNTSGVESIGGDSPPRAARSVHLGWQASESDVFYVEMVVEQTVPGSYFMACGWSGGYFGVQELANGGKVAIFSVWDPTKGDDASQVKPEDRVELLHQGEGVRIRRFGGEGTGGQCMTDFAWKPEQTNRFLVQATVQGDKTAYAGYLFFPDEKEWRHLVTFRTRNDGKALRGLYSFVEDFRRDGKSVEEVRRARFANSWVRTLSGEWQPLRRARFTASRASWEARDNINAGTGGHDFFLATGGDTIRSLELSSTLTVAASASAPPADLPVNASVGPAEGAVEQSGVLQQGTWFALDGLHRSIGCLFEVDDDKSKRFANVSPGGLALGEHQP